MISRLFVLIFLPLIVRADEFFLTKVEPILRERCYQCHSHEFNKIKGGLSLDSRSGWSHGGDSGPAIVPNSPEESLLIKAINYQDPDYEMPPKEKLSGEEILILTEWVKKGASDPRVSQIKTIDTDWWSLRPLKAPIVPRSGHPIDAFIEHSLEQAGLKPTPRAQSTTLVRRLFVTLHGYLPRPEEIHDFVTNTSPDAFKNLIDQLLKSPRYGERWARHWLDTIHFADSHGCEHDVKRPHAWRFRDYVIDRLNADVSWDRFIREQIAADYFYPSQPELIAGLGYLAAGPLELSRAGTAPLTFDYLDRDDMVTQTMASFTSTTANCARCHSHKFDPITQEDYYCLQAVFAGVGKGDLEFERSNEVMTQRQELEELIDAAARLDTKILLQEKYRATVDQWIENQIQKEVTWQTLTPEIFLASGGANLTLEKDGAIFAGGHLADQETYTVSGQVPPTKINAVRLEVLRDERNPKGGPGRAGNGNLHLSEVELQWFEYGSATSLPLKISQASADFDQEGWTSAQAIDGDLQSGWAIFPRINESHQIIFELETPIDTSKGGRLVVTLKQQHPPKHLIGRFRISTTQANAEAARLLSSEAQQALKEAPLKRSQHQNTLLASLALKQHAQKSLRLLPSKEVVYGVSSSWSHAKKLPTPQAPKTVHFLRRGSIDHPMHLVEPGALSALNHFPARFALDPQESEAARRAALANWIAHPQNPLTWRSIVNRVWHYHFGRGLCETPNDFGRMGSLPSHPELLDWLAAWFRDEAKGSLKDLHRLILTSNTWQQASVPTPNTNDTDNQLLWRMNSQRIDAETLRDSVLHLANRLDFTMGGPGIEQFQKSKGPQATPVLDYRSFDWNSPEAARRSIYRVVWRGIPDPFMEAFDFPDLGILAPKRGFSVSALQSLSLFNNEFILHGSQWIARELQLKSSNLTTQVDQLVELIWLRQASTDEQRALSKYAQEFGLAALCRVLLNSNEFLFIQ